MVSPICLAISGREHSYLSGVRVGIVVVGVVHDVSISVSTSIRRIVKDFLGRTRASDDKYNINKILRFHPRPMF